MRAVFPICTVLLPILLAGCDQLTAMAGPSEMVSFGFIRPTSCERRGPVSFNCVMRNHMNAPREANMECAGFDGQKRMVGRPKNVHAMLGVTLMPGEERVATVFYEKGVARFHLRTPLHIQRFQRARERRGNVDEFSLDIALYPIRRRATATREKPEHSKYGDGKNNPLSHTCNYIR